MKTCPSCGAQNPDDQDFCACGEYLRWDPTRFVQAVTADDAERVAPPADSAPSTEAGVPAAPPSRSRPTVTAVQAPAPVAPVRPELIMVTLRLPDGDATVQDPTVQVEPGGRARLLALVRNQSGIVDNYAIQIRGLPDGWWSAEPSTVYLVPYGAAGRGTYEQQVTIDIHPPRAPEAEARGWPVEVVAVSKAIAGEEGTGAAVVEIGPYAELAVQLRPELAGGRLAARFNVAVENRANAPVDVDLSARDTEGSCRFRFSGRRVTVPPGKRIETRLRAHPRRPIWIGRPIERRFEVSATPPNGAAPPATGSGVFRQGAWLPWWVPAAVAALLVLALLIFMLIPSNTTVPDLSRAAGVFDAQKLLDKAGLKLSPQVQQKAVAGKRPGTILDQTPKAGEKVDKGSDVKILVAVGTGKEKVPRVVGLTAVAADQALRKAGLALGAVQPQPDPKAKIESQIPAAGQVVKTGSPVNVFLAAGNGKKGAAALPALAGGSAAAAAAKLSQAGFVPETIARISEAKPGTLIATAPPAGTRLAKGAKVQLLVSAGFPEIAFDDGHDVFVAGGARGQPLRTVAAGSLTEEEPTWAADGTHLAYRSGQQIMLTSVTAQGVAAPVPITDPQEDFHDPAFAPTPDRNVLALIRKQPSGTQLCFAAVGSAGARVSCTPDAGVDIGPPVSWAHDGRSLLAFAVGRSNRNEFGLIRYTTRHPFSPRAGDWGAGRIVTDTSTPGRGVIAGTISPDGKRLAVVSNLDAPAFHVLIAPANDFRLTQAQPLPVQGCTAGWRPDGLELVVVQGDASCSQSVGQLLRVDPAKPDHAAVLRAGAAHPVWQPLQTPP